MLTNVDGTLIAEVNHIRAVACSAVQTLRQVTRRSASLPRAAASHGHSATTRHDRYKTSGRAAFNISETLIPSQLHTVCRSMLRQ